MSNLRPCPFCGSKAGTKIIGAVLHTVVCEKCNASCDVLRTKTDAITAWNTRHTPQASETQKSAAAVLAAQEAKGLSKYGTTLDDAGLTLLEKMEHFQQEAADALMYATSVVEGLKKEAKP